MAPAVSNNANDENNCIVIVTGLPRSGTSMMMQMLAAGGYPILTDKIRKADSSNPKGYFEFEMVKQIEHDQQWLTQALNKAVKMIYILLYHLPDNYQYKLIYMRRSLEEVVQSQSVMLRNKTTTLPDIKPNKLISIYRNQLDQFESWLKEQHNISTLAVDYSSVISDPLTTSSKVNYFLSTNLNEYAMAASVDPKLYRQKVSSNNEVTNT